NPDGEDYRYKHVGTYVYLDEDKDTTFQPPELAVWLQSDAVFSPAAFADHSVREYVGALENGLPRRSAAPAQAYVRDCSTTRSGGRLEIRAVIRIARTRQYCVAGGFFKLGGFIEPDLFFFMNYHDVQVVEGEAGDEGEVHLSCDIPPMNEHVN